MRALVLLSSTAGSLRDRRWPRLGLLIGILVLSMHARAGQSGAPAVDFTVRTGRGLRIGPSIALTSGPSGEFYVASSVSGSQPIDLDGHSVKSTGDTDVLVAKLDEQGKVRWVESYGDARGNPQTGAGVAATKNGTVAVVGTFSGSMTFGSDRIQSGSQIDFLAALRSTDGKGKWARRFDDGSNGHLSVVAANPSSPANRIAVCGRAVQAATDLVPKASHRGNDDVVIGMFDSAGTRLWSAQIGDAGNEQCDALAIDDHGDLYASGRFDSGKLSFGRLPELQGPGNSNRKFIWVAKFDGASGEPRQAASFGGAAGQAWPSAMAIDASGKVVIAGRFTSSLLFGKTNLVGAGSTEAFAAKLDPEVGLAPIWSVRLGGTGVDAANGIDVTSAGEIVVTGFFSRSTTGAAALTANGRVASDVFLLILDGGSGATLAARAYGDAAMQSGEAVAVNRHGGDQVALVGALNGSITLPTGTIRSGGGPEVFLVTGEIERTSAP